MGGGRKKGKRSVGVMKVGAPILCCSGDSCVIVLSAQILLFVSI